MTIPPFPSQDLAKLVLGYLAEEQLMTVYDEFLQASPYLDALQNEYDRIFMTSLKSILAEYRAVKIFVETCKPLALRRKIFHCTNLLDVVKILVTHVDVIKLQSQEPLDKHSSEKHHSINTSTNTCESCTALKLTNCVCTSKLKTHPYSSQSTLIDESSIQNSVEATPLLDLPGHHVTNRKKQIKVLDKDSVYISDCQNSNASKDSSCSNVCAEDIRSNIQMKCDIETVSLNSTVKEIDLTESRKKIEEFDNVLKSVVDKNNTVTGSGSIPNQRVSNASTFQDFACGVSVGESQNSNVPDSSTSESLSIQAPFTKDYKDNAIGPQKRQLLLQVTNRSKDFELQTPKYTKLKPKPDDHKVTILSDIKVTNKKKPVKPVNATSTPLTTTPLMQMQTIVINGTPAYKHTPVDSHMFTKDEIMAMPTLIVVPASGPTQIPTSARCPSILTNCNVATNASSTSRSLGPLLIDVLPTGVGSTSTLLNKPEDNTQLPNLMPVTAEPGLVKTVDFKNASVPKDNVTCVSKTPQGLPPVRKSSSTPRRTTHVRVLDFTTPRRILHETINEQVPTQTSEASVEVVLSSSPNVSLNNTIVAQNPAVNTTAVQSIATVPNTVCCDTDAGSSKENTSKPKPFKKSNWDADLRALIAKEVSLGCPGKFKKNSKKKKASEKSDKSNKKHPEASATLSKAKNDPKNRRKVVDEEENVSPTEPVTKPDVSVKPTINIISKRESGENVPVIPEINKSIEIIPNERNDDDGFVETPESERLSLQNMIGARLNISDLLETPYKQALYDIQMGTPKFLADLPGEPLSDIKISNIPTPRFLDTPKPVQATPSSWSSRPTDYSSGGSYYKPDDQDYAPLPDLRCVVSSSSKEDTTLDKSIEIVKDDEKKSRPQRQCAKNVSYYRLANPSNKTKVTDDTLDTVSTCSDSTGSTECKNKEQVVKTHRSRANKSETKKKIATKKRKSPGVKERKFIKIKPRQTPSKLTPSRIRMKSVTPGYSPNVLKRNRTTSKDKNVEPTEPLAVAAPTKSRRKSSTPRKLHCSKSFNSSSSHTSPEIDVNSKENMSREVAAQDSDTEQIALRWSDDGSQDTKIKESPVTASVNECEDIYQIQKYIQNSGSSQPSEGQVSFQADLMKRGFDVETAKIIERDLLDAPAPSLDLNTKETSTTSVQKDKTNSKELSAEKPVETDSKDKNSEQSASDEIEGEEDEVEFSIHECNEKSKNFFVFEHDDTKEMSQATQIKLKDNFSMDICIDDDVTVRLRATPFSLPLDQDPIEVETIDYSYKETQMAVSSISNIDKLYTPLKDSYKSQCYEIFDSTLTSLDTPLKSYSPREDAPNVTTVTDIVLEEEQIQIEQTEAKKRKRSGGSDESSSNTKKTKYLLTSASIQNIDIESVLTKLHGP